MLRCKSFIAPQMPSSILKLTYAGALPLKQFTSHLVLSVADKNMIGVVHSARARLSFPRAICCSVSMRRIPSPLPSATAILHYTRRPCDNLASLY
jgi:hypothetical protein